MAKKPLIINLIPQKIQYEQNNQTIKLNSFNQKDMTLKISIWEKDQFIKDQTIVFAHLPKSIKSKIKPL